jgi:nucleoid-associated protein YgaU
VTKTTFEKLVIKVEGGGEVRALFNPSKLVFSKRVSWGNQKAAQCDVPQLHFNNGEGRTLSIDLFFDTYDSSHETKKDVRDYTKPLLDMALVRSDKHRPPVCTLSWGGMGPFFQCVLESLEEQFTLFTEGGVPVRATCRCSFREWVEKGQGQKLQRTTSSDVAKSRIIRKGDTLSGIAAEEFGDPALWRHLAEKNDIDDPLQLIPGRELLIPTLSDSGPGGRYR